MTHEIDAKTGERRLYLFKKLLLAYCCIDSGDILGILIFLKLFFAAIPC